MVVDNGPGDDGVMTWRSQTAWGAMTALALLITVASSRYLTVDPELYFPDQREVYETNTALLLTHVIGAMVALTLGPFQFLPRLRRRFTGVHRGLGRAYLAGVGVGGVGGLGLAFVAFGGPVAQVGFAALAVAWLATAGLAVATIRRGDVAAHRRWMIRNMALTFAAVTLRLYLPILDGIGLPFADAYRTVAWLCWLPNLAVAELLVRRRPRAEAAAVAMSRSAPAPVG